MSLTQDTVRGGQLGKAIANLLAFVMRDVGAIYSPARNISEHFISCSKQEKSSYKVEVGPALTPGLSYVFIFNQGLLSAV